MNLSSNKTIYIARDIERTLGTEPSEDYLIVTNDDKYARSIKEKYPDFVLLVKSPIPLDTFEILEKEETADFIKEKCGKKSLENDQVITPVIPAKAGILSNDRVSNVKSNKVNLESSVTQDPRFRGDDKMTYASSSASSTSSNKPNILVFKNTMRIEELCAKKGWRLLNPRAVLAEKIENKISQVDWLGELSELLPNFKIAPAKDIKWEKKPLILQFAHAHTGLGTILINSEKELKEVQKQFPDRPVKASEYIKGPSFTVNVVVTSGKLQVTSKNKSDLQLETCNLKLAENKTKNILRGYGLDNIIIGNPSYQITGMPPLTDSPFATVGNDWSLPHTILSDRHLGELRDIALEVGTKMQESGWKGLFGIDVIYDEERDQLKLIEINARQPASTTYESQLQSKFRGHGLIGSTIFEAHLAALTGSPLTKKQLEINDGAQIVQRVTKAFVQGEPSYKKIASLNKAGYTTIPYLNSKPNSDFLRIQSAKGLMEKDGKFNKRGNEILDILEK
jgi:hypothetical protein